MSFASATKFNRKSGEAEESAVSSSQYQMLTGETVLFIGSRLAMDRLSHPFRCLIRIAEDLFANDAIRRFIQVRVEGALDLKKLRPQRVVNKRIRGTQNDGGLTLARIAIWLQPVAAAQGGKQAPRPTIRQRELCFDRALRFRGRTQRGKNSAARRCCRVSLSHSCGALKKRRYLAQLLA
jgi:hypothetical protein